MAMWGAGNMLTSQCGSIVLVSKLTACVCVLLQAWRLV